MGHHQALSCKNRLQGTVIIKLSDPSYPIHNGTQPVTTFFINHVEDFLASKVCYSDHFPPLSLHQEPAVLFF